MMIHFGNCKSVIRKGAWDKEGQKAEYTCPHCYTVAIERGECQPFFEAKDLPITILSDHIEQRLLKNLKQEREDRARQQGRRYHEVPAAENLVVRVVSCVDKRLLVEPWFLEIFQEGYPSEFLYKSKVLLLFQKIEGIEVCLFGMYVQEFGSECPFPNQRRVFLSHLDSLEYFQPEVKAVTGEALRTFVYHEILIGYLDFCKKRGFTSFYFWACPPLKGEDCILYRHPDFLEMTKSDKLRYWYLAMLRKAAKEQIVVETTNLYDHFFVSTGECKANVTTARLPYFDGDFILGAAEDLIKELRQAPEQSDLSANVSGDNLLINKLGETIRPMKEDFIMVHLQHCCNHCCIPMVSGNRWVCNQCRNFKICDKCYRVDQNPKCHPHTLNSVEITDVSADTKDEDEILEAEIFDSRLQFVVLCRRNHLDYDTLMQAKHSSTMVLYLLHNPTAPPAFATICDTCYRHIGIDRGWHCESCQYDVCNLCYEKNGVGGHSHELTNKPSNTDSDHAQNTRQQRVVKLRRVVDLLVHASQCTSRSCQHQDCRKLKVLFLHGCQGRCKAGESGGCILCQNMWYIIYLHARACKVSECKVPRCRSFMEYSQRVHKQYNSRRRAAAMEMRQRAAESLTFNLEL